MLSIGEAIINTTKPVLRPNIITVGAGMRTGAGLQEVIGSANRKKIMASMQGRQIDWDLISRRDAMFRKSPQYHEWAMNADNARMILQDRKHIRLVYEMQGRAATIEAIMGVMDRVFHDVENEKNLTISRHLNENPLVKSYLTNLFALKSDLRIDLMAGKPSEYAEVDVFGQFQESCKEFCQIMSAYTLPHIEFIDADGTDKDFGLYVLLRPSDEFMKEAGNVGYKQPYDYM